MNILIFSYVSGFVVLAVKLAAFGTSTWRDRSREFRCVRVWLGILAAEDIVAMASLQVFSLHSFWYARIYYGADLVSILCGLFVILRLSEIAMQDRPAVVPLLRRGAVAIVAGLILISAVGVASAWGHTQSRDHFVEFAIQLEQNVNAAGMLAALLLWVSLNALSIPGVRLRRLAAALGLSFSSGAISWAFFALFHQYDLVEIMNTLTALSSVLLITWTLSFGRSRPPSAPAHAAHPESALGATNPV